MVNDNGDSSKYWNHHDSAIHLYLPKKYRNSNLQSYMHLCVHHSIVYNRRYMETTWVSADRWMDKEDTHIHTIEYYLAIKRWNLGIWDSMDGPYMLTRMNLRWKKTNILLFHLYVAYKNKWRNKQTKKSE